MQGARTCFPLCSSPRRRPRPRVVLALPPSPASGAASVAAGTSVRSQRQQRPRVVRRTSLCAASNHAIAHFAAVASPALALSRSSSGPSALQLASRPALRPASTPALQPPALLSGRHRQSERPSHGIGRGAGPRCPTFARLRNVAPMLLTLPQQHPPPRRRSATTSSSDDSSSASLSASPSTFPAGVPLPLRPRSSAVRALTPTYAVGEMVTALATVSETDRPALSLSLHIPSHPPLISYSPQEVNKGYPT